MNPMSRVLVVEDEFTMRNTLKDCLEGEGYRVLTAADGETALKRVLEDKPDLILLDVMLPKLDGYTVCNEIRRLANPTPVIMLTAKGQVSDRVDGLDAGADDYLVKPFSLEELLARIRALLRRIHQQSNAPRALSLDDVHVDFIRQQAWRLDQPLHLPPKEIAMLRMLAESLGHPVSRDRFLDVVWGYATFPTTRTVDTHVATLRAKIEPDPDNPRWIKTVHGVGYKLDLSSTPSSPRREES